LARSWLKRRVFGGSIHQRTGPMSMTLMRSLLLAALSAAAWVSPGGGAARAQEPGGQAGQPVQVVVDLSSRELYVTQGDQVVRTYSIAVGSPGHPTPTGTFTIRHIVWNPRWVPPDAKWARGKKPRAPGSALNPMGRVKLFFQEPDYYIHGTRDEDSLGQAESHGCVRMRNTEVADLARIVMESGGALRPPSWWRRVFNRVTHTQEVRLSDPVRVTVRE
jgi:lipoprotein-anchoring transpeptidase ErfK/SrfK